MTSLDPITRLNAAQAGPSSSRAPRSGPPESGDFDVGTPRLNYIANLVGHPGLNIPCGFDPDGMPLCLQIVASPFGDQAALDFGISFQNETDWHLRRPEYPWRR